MQGIAITSHGQDVYSDEALKKRTVVSGGERGQSAEDADVLSEPRAESTAGESGCPVQGG